MGGLCLMRGDDGIWFMLCFGNDYVSYFYQRNTLNKIGHMLFMSVNAVCITVYAWFDGTPLFPFVNFAVVNRNPMLFSYNSNM